MGLYRVETKNGVVLTSPNIHEIIEHLSDMEYDRAIKFSYIEDETEEYFQEYIKEMEKA